MNKYIYKNRAACRCCCEEKAPLGCIFCILLQVQLKSGEKCPCGCCKVSTASRRSGPESLKCEEGYS